MKRNRPALASVAHSREGGLPNTAGGASTNPRGDTMAVVPCRVVKVDAL